MREKFVCFPICCSVVEAKQTFRESSFVLRPFDLAQDMLRLRTTGEGELPHCSPKVSRPRRDGLGQEAFAHHEEEITVV